MTNSFLNGSQYFSDEYGNLVDHEKDFRPSVEGLIEVLYNRESDVQDGRSIQGIEMESIQQLVISTERLEDDLERLEEVVGEVVALESCPELCRMEAWSR